MDDIQHAIQIVKNGGIIIYPTDTAFGIGCRIDDHDSIDRLFSLRKRPVTQAMPVLVSSIPMALAYFKSPSKIVRHLMVEHWPGALTIVSYCKMQMVYSPIRGDGKTVGLRMPNHSVPLTIITGVGVPMVGPSANFHGERTPYSLEDLNPDLIAKVDYIVPGVCKLRQASTVIDCTSDPYTIIRQGAVHV